MNRVTLATVALAALLVPLSVYGQTSDTDVKAFTDEIRALKARVEQLERRAPTQAEIDAAKARVSADVATKSAAGDVIVKFDENGFYIGTRDERFSIRPHAGMMVRYSVNSRKGSGNDGDQTDEGFEIRRMKLYASGTAYTKDLTYYIDFGSKSNTGKLTLVDAYTSYRFYDDWYVRGGQFKNPYAHEFAAPDLKMFTSDYSLVSELIGGHNAGRTQGFELLYGNSAKNNPINAIVTLNDGDKKDNTTFEGNDASRFGAAARLEWKAFGDWKSYGDFSHVDSRDDLLVFGAGVSMSQGTDTIYRSTVDAQYEFADRWTLYVAGYLNERLLDQKQDELDAGGQIVLGYLATKNIEPFVRYDAAFFGQDQANGNDRAQEYTAGVNFYPSFGTSGPNENLKFTADVSYLPDGSPAESTNLSVLKGAGEQWIGRVQFKLVF